MAFVTDNGAGVVCAADVVFKEHHRPRHHPAPPRVHAGAWQLQHPTICGLEACYVRRQDREHDAFFRTFYHNIEYVDSLGTFG